MKPRLGETAGRLLPLIFLWSFMGAAASADPNPEIGWRVTPNPALASPAQRLPAPPANLPNQLILDDDGAESVFGFAGALPGTARQFLWFNQFPGAGEFLLEEIWVLFPPGANMSVGTDVQLVVYHDPDGDPTNGATALASYDETIQVLDGVTFSVYPLPSPLFVPAGGDVLIGVISRFVVSDMTSSTDPAAIDTTASQGRSWVAVWTGDPPPPPGPPALPPDLFLDTVDAFVGGNWMIRGFGRSQPVTEIPTLGPAGLGLLLLLIGAAAVRRLRRG